MFWSVIFLLFTNRNRVRKKNFQEEKCTKIGLICVRLLVLQWIAGQDSLIKKKRKNMKIRLFVYY